MNISQLVTSCPLCHTQAQYIFGIKDYKIYECYKCSHRSTTLEDPKYHVTSTYSDDYFFSGGAGYPNYLDERDLLMQHGRAYGKVLSKYIQRPGKVLDAGAAAGFILKGLTDVGWKGYGIEPNDSMASYARERLGLEVQTGTFELYTSKHQYDLLCFIQVIAHLMDPRRAIRVAYDIISPNGYLLVETWNYKSLTAKIFGRRWHEYSPPSVLHWFSKESLNRIMREFHFDLIATGRPKKRLLFNHAKSLVLFKLNNYPLTRPIKVLLRLIPDNFPVRYPAEDLFWALFKKR